jgi:uncharacterized cupin superfamily protein
MNYVIEGSGALVNEKGEEQSMKAGDFALVIRMKNTSIVTRAMCLSR